MLENVYFQKDTRKKVKNNFLPINIFCNVLQCFLYKCDFLLPRFSKKKPKLSIVF